MGEVLAAIGGVEAFREDYEGGTSFGGLEDTVAGSSEVGSFVGPYDGGVRAAMGWRWGRETACCELHKG